MQLCLGAALLHVHLIMFVVLLSVLPPGYGVCSEIKRNDVPLVPAYKNLASLFRIHL